MRYLAFDIECCDGKHICEFGYVITDEKFNIIKKSVSPQILWKKLCWMISEKWRKGLFSTKILYEKNMLGIMQN